MRRNNATDNTIDNAGNRESVVFSAIRPFELPQDLINIRQIDMTHFSRMILDELARVIEEQQPFIEQLFYASFVPVTWSPSAGAAAAVQRELQQFETTNEKRYQRLQNIGVEVPALSSNEWRCLISLQLMDDPVRIPGEPGLYERRLVEHWLSEHSNQSPATRNHCDEAQLIPAGEVLQKTSQILECLEQQDQQDQQDPQEAAVRLQRWWRQNRARLHAPHTRTFCFSHTAVSADATDDYKQQREQATRITESALARAVRK